MTRSPDEIRDWLDQKSSELDNLSPRDILDRHTLAQLTAILDQMETK